MPFLLSLQARRALACVVGVAALIGGCREAPGTAAPVAEADEATRVGYDPAMLDPDLGRFFFDLKRLENGQLAQVRILQLGDSHTAGDYLSGRLRALFQARFGNAGRGMMPPGHPFDGLRQQEVTVTQTGPWAIDNSLNVRAVGPYGISGFLAHSTAAGARMTVSPNEGTIDSASVDYVEHPGGGQFQVDLDDRVVATISTSGPEGKPGRIIVPAPSGTRQLAVVAQAPGVGLTAWSIERRAHGILLDSHGVSGATVGLIDRWDPAIVARDIDQLRPSLIVLAYGTNEGYADTIDAAAYIETFTSVLHLMKRLAPQASILVVGPPDAQRPDPGCRTRQSAPAACHWYTPTAMARVREIQRAAARDAHAAFWDWSGLMQGPGGIDAWVHATPPLARGDHVHFTVAGYEKAADGLFADLMTRFTTFQEAATVHLRRPS